MGNYYSHLTLPIRKLIAVKLNQQQKSIRQIAKELHVSPNTVSLEIRRNKVKATNKTIYNGATRKHKVKIVEAKYLYDALIAQLKANKRATKPRIKHKIIQGLILYATINQMLHDGYKPDTIAGRLKLAHPNDTTFHVSYESIYLYAYKHLQTGWWEYLNKARKKRKTRSTRKTGILNRQSIHIRSKQADTRAEIGHFEGDSVVGCRGESRKIINTGVDKKSRFMIASFVSDKTADNTYKAILSSTKNIRPYLRSFTFDNGSEFAKHEQLAKTLNINIFFADPYSSWQRGSNERHNGLTRRFFPKDTNFDTITKQELANVIEFWNNYPRKILNYHTPKEIWDNEVAKPTTQKQPKPHPSVLLKP